LIGRIDGLDLSNRSNLSLLWLLFKIKQRYRENQEPIHLIVDDGKSKAGANVGRQMFPDWSVAFHGSYASSIDEPLLQIADFIAYCINRSTMKRDRTEIDKWFLNLVVSMQINCSDIKVSVLPSGFSVSDFDEILELDRQQKKLPEL
jgi:hypothetical protein